MDKPTCDFNNHLLFSAKVKLEKEFLMWSNENNVLNCPLSVITWLEIKGFIKVDAIKSYLGKDYGIKRRK